MPLPKRRRNRQHQRVDQIDRDSFPHQQEDGVFRDTDIIEFDDDDDDHMKRHINTTNTVENNVLTGSNDDDSKPTRSITSTDSNSSHAQSHAHCPPHHSPQYLDIEDAIERLGMGRFQYGVFLACGLCFAADAMEVLLLSFLAVILQEEWNLTEGQTDSIISVVFAGAMLGTLVLSALGDIWGRRPVFAITAGLISLFGMATALCTTYTQLLVARFLVGFGVGGLTVPYDALGEVMGSTFRGKNLLSTSYFWTGGSLLVPLFAWMTIGGGKNDEPATAGSWRGFVVLCAIPCVVSTVLGVWLVPESPRFLVSKGKNERAISILRKAAAKNGKEPYITYPEGTILVDGHAPSSKETPKPPLQQESPEQTEVKNCCYLFSSPQWRKISFFLSWQWFGLAFTYYGCIIAVSIVFSDEESGDVSADMDTAVTDADTSSGSYEFDYSAILISSSAEVVGLTFAIMVVDCWGRVPTQTLTYFLGGLCVLILGLLDFYVGGGVQVTEFSISTNSSSAIEEEGTQQVQEERRHLIFFAFLSRLFIMSATSCTWLHTSELLPTEIRATGHGLANAMGRIGGLLSPFIITESSSLRLIGAVMFAVSVMTSLCSHCLPETAGMAMGDFSGSVESNAEFMEELELTETIPNPDICNTNNQTSLSTGNNTTTTAATTTTLHPTSSTSLTADQRIDQNDVEDDSEEYEIL